MKIVFVHGRAQQQQNPATLQAAWELGLRQGLDAAGLAWPGDAEFRFPYYGDELDRLVRAIDAPTADDAVARGEAGSSAEDDLQRDIILEMANKSELTDRDVEQVIEGEAPAVNERGPQNWPWVLAILRALDGKAAGDRLLERVTRDVSIYLAYEAAVRQPIDEIVRRAIPDEPCVLVAHSLGSVVAYNVLRTLQRPASSIRLVTVGSPLGINAVHRVLEPLRHPPCVRSWYNARDPKDVVALWSLDKDHFPVTPRVENKDDLQNPTPNHHGIAGYLGHPDVARRIVGEL